MANPATEVVKGITAGGVGMQFRYESRLSEPLVFGRVVFLQDLGGNNVAGDAFPAK